MGEEFIDENANCESTINDGTINDLATNIALGEYALVIGPEIVMNDSCAYNHSENIMLPDVIKEINKGKKTQINPNDYKSFSELSEEVDTSEIKKGIFNVLKKWKYDVANRVNPGTKKLLQSGMFRSIIVTTFDSYVETILREKWGEDLTVVSLWNKVGREQKMKKHSYVPTLYYAFGKADFRHPDNSPFVVSDIDRLKTMEHLMRNHKALESIEEKKFIAIGNRMDDWLFRFFWFVITSGCVDTQVGNKVVRLFEENSESDNNLKRYLKKIDVIVDDTMNPRDFIKILNNCLSDNIKSYLKEFNKSGQVFISYSHDDLPVALNLYNYLQNNNIDTWMDVRLEDEATRDGYHKDIVTAINNSKVFLILLSKNVAERMKSGKGGYLIDEEWKDILSAMKNNALIPAAITGYDERADYHTKIFEKEKFPIKCQTVCKLYESNTKKLPLENLRDRIKNLLKK